MNKTVQQTTLHWEAALAIAQAALGKGQELGIRVAVAVMDRGGNLLAFARDPGAPFHSSQIAQDKATTSAGFGLPTKQWWPVLEGMNSPGLLAGIAAVPRMVVFGGGVPVYLGSDCIAGVGVSGGSEEEDEICARAGLAAAGLVAEPG
ncbi:heme-binding protein [Immundisolibacter sp.]|uniref:GlcG/HbpS family heme-binding protein n=1 Tax=Immundisolibacter sp. TaxID=1934948 RepID=UPI00356B3AB6